MEEIFQITVEKLGKRFNRWISHFDQRLKDTKENNENKQRLAGLQHQAQQPHLAIEAGEKACKETPKRTEGAATDEEKSTNRPFARAEENSTSSTSFGKLAEPSAAEKCIGEALVNKGAKAPKPRLPSVEVRMLSSTAGGLLFASTASITKRTKIFSPPLS